MEDKDLICELLTETLQQTRMFKDLELLTYKSKPGIEIVKAVFTDGKEYKVNVHMDSGIALISDVIKALRCQRG